MLKRRVVISVDTKILMLFQVLSQREIEFYWSYSTGTRSHGRMAPNYMYSGRVARDEETDGEIQIKKRQCSFCSSDFKARL